MKKTLKIIIAAIVIVLICIISVVCFNKDNLELKTIKSKKELSKIYEGEITEKQELFLKIITTPFSFFIEGSRYDNYDMSYVDTSSTTMKAQSNSKKDYSTTNIQVENVDEADITKTDGNYIYSISDNNVIITNVIDPNKIEIAAKIELTDESIPEDLILYKEKLVVISTKSENSDEYSYKDSQNTVVKIYDIQDKASPKLEKDYELYEPYYTSRCINNQLYVISSGRLRTEEKDDDNIVTYYKEDNKQKDIELNNIKYLKDIKTDKQTLISVVNLDDVKSEVNISSYLMNISNAYVSENSIYLLDQKYEYGNKATKISSLFGLKGVLGVLLDNENNDSNYYTKIYKFNILNNGNVVYDTKTKVEGKTINQYSLDELNGHLRVALYDNNGTRILIFNEKLKQIGESETVAKGEKMYSSRFMGNKVYLVTYKTVDPLFVIDLSNEESPKVLGELKIPGYSTYLHPYDENHLIGIGMETEEVINRNSSGRIISNTAKIIGMKMALFDVSDVNNPVQISSTVIGDRRTTSAILTNPKALLFSKEKELIAIPVNNYKEDFEINNSSDSYDSLVNSYANYYKSYVAEGYFVYKINIEDGFKLKGIVTHETPEKESSYDYYWRSKLLRGMYIDDNLYTVSETAIKVNNLDTLKLISELKIK